MSGSLLNIITIFAYTALAVDFLLQIHRVWKERHSKDISVMGVIARTTAATIILIKIAVVGDTLLLIGQFAMVLLLLAYLGTVLRFRNAT